MNQVKQPEDSSSAWQFTKGMVVSNVALVTVLIKSGVISPSDVIEVLDGYIEIFTNKCPENLALIEPIKLTKDMITTLYPANGTELSATSKAVWVADFIGEA